MTRKREEKKNERGRSKENTKHMRAITERKNEKRKEKMRREERRAEAKQRENVIRGERRERRREGKGRKWKGREGKATVVSQNQENNTCNYPTDRCKVELIRRKPGIR